MPNGNGDIERIIRLRIQGDDQASRTFEAVGLRARRLNAEILNFEGTSQRLMRGGFFARRNQDEIDRSMRGIEARYRVLSERARTLGRDTMASAKLGGAGERELSDIAERHIRQQFRMRDAMQMVQRTRKQQEGAPSPMAAMAAGALSRARMLSIAGWAVLAGAAGIRAFQGITKGMEQSERMAIIMSDLRRQTGEAASAFRGLGTEVGVLGVELGFALEEAERLGIEFARVFGQRRAQLAMPALGTARAFGMMPGQVGQEFTRLARAGGIGGMTGELDPTKFFGLMADAFIKANDRLGFDELLRSVTTMAEATMQVAGSVGSMLPNIIAFQSGMAQAGAPQTLLGAQGTQFLLGLQRGIQQPGLGGAGLSIMWMALQKAGFTGNIVDIRGVLGGGLFEKVPTAEGQGVTVLKALMDFLPQIFPDPKMAAFAMQNLFNIPQRRFMEFQTAFAKMPEEKGEGLADLLAEAERAKGEKFVFGLDIQKLGDAFKKVANEEELRQLQIAVIAGDFTDTFEDIGSALRQRTAELSANFSTLGERTLKLQKNMKDLGIGITNLLDVILDPEKGWGDVIQALKALAPPVRGLEDQPGVRGLLAFSHPAALAFDMSRFASELDRLEGFLGTWMQEFGKVLMQQPLGPMGLLTPTAGGDYLTRILGLGRRREGEEPQVLDILALFQRFMGLREAGAAEIPGGVVDLTRQLAQQSRAEEAEAAAIRGGLPVAGPEGAFVRDPAGIGKLDVATVEALQDLFERLGINIRTELTVDGSKLAESMEQTQGKLDRSRSQTTPHS